MPTLTTVARNAACNAIVDLIDAGASANGRLEITTSGGASVLAEFDFPATAYGSAGAVTPGVASLTSTISEASTPAAGTAAELHVYDETVAAGGGNEIFSGTVGTSGADLNLTSVSIGVGEAIDITQLDVTVPAN